jgi:hypothetical protein
MDLAQWLLARADGDEALPEDAKLAVLAALDGDEELDEALDGTYSRPEAQGVEGDAETAPIAAFLKSISVAGFRGIGPEANVALHPVPGLVVIAGRNGSGKSSFAEALEVALTGDSAAASVGHRPTGEPR